MTRNYFYIILGITGFCLLLILFSLIREKESDAKPPDYVKFPIAPFKTYITGLGIVEANGGNIKLGAATDRIVDKIVVHTGQKIGKNEPLILLQNDDLKAELEIQKVAYATSKLNLDKLKILPRKEDLQMSEAAVKNSELDLQQAQKQYQMVEGLERTKAMSLEEINRRYYNYKAAELKLDQSKAEAEKVRKGTWQPDLETAQLQVLQADANVKRIQAEIDKTLIRSPVDGTVVEVKTHVGEYPTYPIAIVGDTSELELKVSINQFDSHLFNPKAHAVAFVQGNPKEEVELQFVKLIPYLTSKQNLSNDVKEVVDTKVLQVIYRIKNRNPDLYIGQPMDVYIETEHHS